MVPSRTGIGQQAWCSLFRFVFAPEVGVQRDDSPNQVPKQGFCGHLANARCQDGETVQEKSPAAYEGVGAQPQDPPNLPPFLPSMHVHVHKRMRETGRDGGCV